MLHYFLTNDPAEYIYYVRIFLRVFSNSAQPVTNILTDRLLLCRPAGKYSLICLFKYKIFQLNRPASSPLFVISTEVLRSLGEAGRSGEIF